MVRPLILTVPHRPGQTATSLASGLAARNFQPNVRVFCSDMGVPFPRIVDGETGMIEKLATLAGADLTCLMRSTYVKAQGASFRLNGQLLSQESLHRQRLVCCPICVSNAMENGPHEPHVNVYGMAYWQIATMRTCFEHFVAIQAIGAMPRTNWTHDFSSLVRQHSDEIRRHALEPTERPPSDFEHYQNARLVGDAPREGWLDTLPFSVATKACEVFGASAEFGTRFNISSLSEADLARAGATGYAILKNGVDGAKDYLSTLHRNPNLKGISGYPEVYGTIYLWLTSNRRHSLDFEPVRQVVREHILDTMPVGVGETVLGKPVEQRRFHSIRTLSVELNATEKTVRRNLGAVGIVDNNDRRPDHKVTFPVEPASSFITRVFQGQSQVELRANVNMPELVLKGIIKKGYIRPIVDVKGIKPRYHPADLQEFMERLLIAAVAVERPLPDQVSIEQASRNARCEAVDIVAFILNGQLSWVGTLNGVRGYAAILVDRKEVAQLTDGSPTGGMGLNELANDFGVNDSAARQFVEAMGLSLVTVEHPRAHVPVRVIPNGEIARLKKEYVSLRDVAKTMGRTARWARHELALRGIHTIDAGDPRIFIYRRSDLS